MKLCKIKSCNKRKYVRGYCIKHYTQILRHGKILERTMRDPNEIIIKEKIAEVVLYDRNCQEVARAIIDVDDIEKIKDYKWHLTLNGYVITKINNKTLRMQNLIMDFNSSHLQMVDHKDRDTLNNQKDNLRYSTQSQNQQNRGKPSNNSSGFKGVYWNKKKKRWVAEIRINQKKIYLGQFKDKIKAAKKYNMGAIEYFGKFAYLNEV